MYCRNQILTLDQSPTIRSETEKTLIWNATVFGKTVFGVSNLVFGVRSKANMFFHSIFNKEQNVGSVVELTHL